MDYPTAPELLLDLARISKQRLNLLIQNSSFQIQSPSFSIQIHHCKCKIHHFPYKIHHFKCKTPHLSRPEVRGIYLDLEKPTSCLSGGEFIPRKSYCGIVWVPLKSHCGGIACGFLTSSRPVFVSVPTSSTPC